MGLPNNLGKLSNMITSTGSAVGIGTTNPNDLLEVSGGFIRLSATAGNGPQFNIYSNGQTNNHVTLAQGFALATDNVGYLYNRANAAFVFGTNNAERMRITATGNVGIGTGSPWGKFNVVDGTNKSFVVQDAGMADTIELTNYTNSGGLRQMLINSSNILFYTGTAGGGTATERMRITSGGDVVIGNSTTGARLTTWGAGTGTSTFSFVAYNASGFGVLACRDDWRVSLASLGTGTVYSNGGALTNTNPSDLRLKTNVESVEYGLNEILQLNPVTYDLKEDKLNQGKQYGFIAQEVQEVMPDLVKPLQFEEDLLGLDKEAIYTILVKAIQEQQEIINELSAKVTALENK